MKHWIPKGLCASLALLMLAGNALASTQITVPEKAKEKFPNGNGTHVMSTEFRYQPQEAAQNLASYAALIQTILQEEATLPNRTTWEASQGFLYDVDGNGIQELFIGYPALGGESGWLRFFGRVYTQDGNGTVVPLLEPENFHGEVDGIGGFLGVVSWKGNPYICVHHYEWNGTSFEPGDLRVETGEWSLYTLQGASCEASTKIVYRYGVVEDENGAESYPESDITQNGTPMSIEEYLRFVDSIQETALLVQNLESSDGLPLGELAQKIQADLVSNSRHTGSESGAPFADVAPGSWYAEAVNWAVERGIAAGTSETTFQPDLLCSRAQILTFLWRAFGRPAPTGGRPFADIPEGAYYTDAAGWAFETGLLEGICIERFVPEVPVTRRETVLFLYRAAGSPAVSGENPFRDIASDNASFQAILWAFQNGITAGTSADTFDPDGSCTRGQIVAFLHRMPGLGAH